jgi:hypothetical protein
MGWAMTWTRQIAALSFAAALASSSACDMRKDGPDFKRFSRKHPFSVSSAIHRVGDLEMQLISGYTMQVYTVLGSQHWTVNVQANVSNTGSQPLTIPLDSIGVFMAEEDPHPSVVYYREVRLEPGAKQEITLAIPAGLRYFVKPHSLVYNGVRMDIQ